MIILYEATRHGFFYATFHHNYATNERNVSTVGRRMRNDVVDIDNSVECKEFFIKIKTFSIKSFFSILFSTFCPLARDFFTIISISSCLTKANTFASQFFSLFYGFRFRRILIHKIFNWLHRMKSIKCKLADGFKFVASWGGLSRVNLQTLF